jgi:hypothetical protein
LLLLRMPSVLRRGEHFLVDQRLLQLQLPLPLLLCQQCL